MFLKRVKHRYLVVSESLKFSSDELQLLYDIIHTGENTYDYLLSKNGDESWEYYCDEENIDINDTEAREDWAKEQDQFHLDNGNPAHYFDQPKKLTNIWVIHFTTSDPYTILKNGIKGKGTFGVALTNSGHTEAGNLVFAFSFNDNFDWWKYGERAIVLKVKECLRVYHNSDNEFQIIFDKDAIIKQYVFEEDTQEGDFVLSDINRKEIFRVDDVDYLEKELLKLR